MLITAYTCEKDAPNSLPNEQYFTQICTRKTDVDMFRQKHG
jgi:hypothetical protein